MTLVLLVLGTAMLNVPSAVADQPPGKMAWKFNIIGVPRGTSAPGADAGNGGRIFIPLKTTTYKEPCSTIANPAPVQTLAPEGGVKIVVSEGPFDIVDGDAVADGRAAFTMPAGYYDVYVIGKGKPGGAACIASYVYQDTYYYLIGQIEIKRGTGKPVWQKVNFLLYGPKGEIWFASSYEEYFWYIWNNNMRNMEVRFYTPYSGWNG